MNKKIESTIIMFIGTGLNIILGFITVPIITHIVDPADYGLFSLSQTYITVLAMICLFGFDQAYVRYYYSENTDSYKSSLSKQLLVIPICFSFFAAALIFVCGDIVLDLDRHSLFWVALCVIVTVIDSFTRLSVRLEQNSRLYSALLIIHRIVYAVAVISLVRFSDLKAVDALLIATFLSLAAIIIYAITKERKIWLRKSSAHHTISYKEIFKYSYPFVFSSIASWVFNAMDKISIQHYSTYEELGYYAAGANVVALVTVIQTTFTTIWVPIAVETFENNPDNLKFFKKSFDLMVPVMIVVGSVVIVLKDVFAWILGGNYIMAKFLYPCLILHPVLFTLSEVTVYGINFYKKTYWHIVITVGSCIVNLFGNMTLVPLLGAKGAAISTGLSYIVFFTLRTLTSKRYFPVKYKFTRFSICLLLFVGFCLYSSFYETNVFSLLQFALITSITIAIYNKEIKYAFTLFKSYIVGRKKGDN